MRQVDIKAVTSTVEAGKTSKLSDSATPVAPPQRHDHVQISQCGTLKDKYRAYCFFLRIN